MSTGESERTDPEFLRMENDLLAVEASVAIGRAAALESRLAGVEQQLRKERTEAQEQYQANLDEINEERRRLRAELKEATARLRSAERDLQRLLERLGSGLPGLAFRRLKAFRALQERWGREQP